MSGMRITHSARMRLAATRAGESASSSSTAHTPDNTSRTTSGLSNDGTNDPATATATAAASTTSECTPPSTKGTFSTDSDTNDALSQSGATSVAAAAAPAHPEVAAAAAATSAAATSAAALSAAAVAAAAAPPPRPASIHDISNGDHILGFGASLGPEHPGYSDEGYKKRRAFIADLAKLHQLGHPIPGIDYTADETRVWGMVLSRLQQLYPTHACQPFLEMLPKFGFSPREVPQLEDVSQVLQRETGWRIRPVAGLLHPRDFLNGLAFKYFHSTQYVRHISNPMYTPEPDICHELLGHAPMLAHPEFANVAQAIGQASLGATEKELWHLTKLYWFTVEFGVVMEVDGIKAFGAGLLSSYGELLHLRDNKEVSFVPLDPFKKFPRMSYKDGFQKNYFICQSFSDLTRKLQGFARLYV